MGHDELKNSLQEVCNIIGSICRRIDQDKERTSKLKAWFFKLTQSDNNKEKIIKSSEKTYEMYGMMSRDQTYVSLASLKKRKREQSKLENIVENIIHENFPSFARETDIKMQEIRRNLQDTVRMTIPKTSIHHIL